MLMSPSESEEELLPTDTEPLPCQTCSGQLASGQSLDAPSLSSEIKENDENSNDDAFNDLNISSLPTNLTGLSPCQDKAK